MQVSVEATGSIQRKMTIIVPSENIDQEVDKRLKEMRSRVRLDGFRPGKVPLSMVKKIHGAGVYQEVAGSMIQTSFYQAAEQEKLRVAGLPNIDIKTIEYGKNLEYSATFDVYPELEIASLEGKTVTKQVAEVTDADIDKMIETLRNQQKEWVDVDRAAQEGDLVTIDFDGTVDGEAFEGGKAEDFQVELGANRMLPDFEAALVGMKAGDEKTADVNFPEDYQSEELKGKTAQFALTVKKVQEPKIPEIDEEFIKRFGVEDGTVESFRKNIAENMERELKNKIAANIKTQVMDHLADLHEFDIPAALVTDEIKHMRQEMTQNTGNDMSALPDELFKDEAERRVKLGLIVGEIIRQNDIQKDPAKVDAKLEELASTYEDPEALIDYYRNNQQAMQTIEAAVLEDAIVDWALEQVTTEEEACDFDTVMTPKPQNTEASDDAEQSESDEDKAE